MRKWKLAFVSGFGYVGNQKGYGSLRPGYGGMDVTRVIESLKSLGYDGIEWNQDYFDPDKPLHELRELVDRTRHAGMEVSRIMAHEDLVSLDKEELKRRIDKTVRVIHRAGACGVATVGTMTGPAPWDPKAPRIGRDISESDAWGQVLAAYSLFIHEAEIEKVVISSEGVFGMIAHDFYTHRYLMEKCASPFHKVNLDPSHDTLHGHLDCGWIVREWNDRIAHVHLKDAVGEPVVGKFVFPLLGEGLVDWPSFFSALDEIDYRGFCSVEFECFRYFAQILKGDAEAAARLSRDHIETLLQQTGI